MDNERGVRMEGVRERERDIEGMGTSIGDGAWSRRGCRSSHLSNDGALEVNGCVFWSARMCGSI